MLRNLRDAIRKEEKTIGNRLAANRRIVCGWSKRIGRPHGRTALPMLSVFMAEF